LAIGEIKRLQTETGIGFIREAGANEDILFHATALVDGTFDRLTEGQSVEFDRKAYANAAGKDRAVNVRPIVGAA
jgi:cold shock CspA family protein